MSKHRATRRVVRRRGRVGVLGFAVAVTIAVGGAVVGVLPQLKAGPAAAVGATSLETATIIPVPSPAAETGQVDDLVAKVDQAVDPAVDPGLPADSGNGRRIVFSESAQRVWLVGADNAVVRTYLVSGSRFDNLDPGSYAVQARLRNATAFDYSGTMEYFVQFTTGDNAPIGFHTVPLHNDGTLEQTKAQLGTPLSAGCVRQWEPDAVALWEFAPIGTTVTVTA